MYDFGDIINGKKTGRDNDEAYITDVISEFEIMASEAVRTSGISERAYVKLKMEDVFNIFQMCR